MSFRKNDYQQITLNDSYLNLSPRVKKMVANSWAKDFADIVFPSIDEERFSVLYSDNKASRPNAPVNSIVGSLMLKEQTGLSDDELLESICCDVRYQYALHTTQYEEQPFSDRTFSRFRLKVSLYESETGINLLEEEMKHLSEAYAKYMNLNSSIKRMDSLMIASNMKRMSRLEIIYTVTSNAIKLICHLGKRDILPDSLSHYFDDDDLNKVIYHCKNEDVDSRLQKAIDEAVQVKAVMGDEFWSECSEYQLLDRVLSEQTVKDNMGKTVPKPKKEITSSSLQNPSDPDATFREKAGKDHKGYVGNIVETVGEDGDTLISGFSFDKNTHSDSEFCKEYLNGRKDDAEQETLIADGAYGGHDNKELAKSKNVNLVTTALTGQLPDPIFAEFKMSEDGTSISECPAGYSPIKSSFHPKTNMCRAKFTKDCCADCPNRERCRSKEQKNSFAVYVSITMVERAQYVKELSTDKMKELTRKRNAIEGIPSVLRRKYHIDKIPVRGLLRIKPFALFKIMAYNNNKLFRHMKRQRAKCALNAATC